MRFLLLLIIFPLFIQAQEEFEVPDEMYFLDTKIKIKNSAKREIASSVAMLKKSKAYYQTKLDRVDAYFPIIERVFEAEGVPDDFKFLSIQESSLTSDAVSSSQAVGFWQFKKEAAMEHGLRIDHKVDERKNISASTRAAASYLKKSNAIFNNWIYSLQSYNVGLGGTQRSVDSRYFGAKEMEINGSTHWYVLKCIAHKLAFGEEEGKNGTPPLFLFEYANCKGKSWEELARELQVDEKKLREYNKWLNSSSVPEDKDYLITVPATYLEKDAVAQKIGTVPSSITASTDNSVIKRDIKPMPGSRPVSTRALEMYPGEKPHFVLHNGLASVKAKPGDDINKLAIQSGISRARFLKYNDLRVFDQIVPDEYYYIVPKRFRSDELFHTVKQGETLRDISQQYGITISSIIRKNRMKKGEVLQAGRELWLKNRRPENVPVKIVKPQPAIQPVKPVTQVTSPGEIPRVPAPTHKDSIPIIPKPALQQSGLPVNSNYKDSLTLNPSVTTIHSAPGAELKTTRTSPSIKDTTLIISHKVEGSVKSDNRSYKDTIHVVQQKESLYSISRIYNTKPDSIIAWNGLDTLILKVSQVLTIRLPIKEIKKTTLNHTVAPGETLYRIAEKYKVSVKDIQEWNNKNDFTLSVGQTLIIMK